MKDELKQHYLDTTYIVYLDGQQYDIHIGQDLPNEIRQLLNTTQERSAVIMTAWNPRSQSLPALENKQRNQSLLSSLKVKDYSIYNALGEGKESSWPSEESYFILGISKKGAESYSTENEQYAYVWIESGKPAKLVFTPLW